MNHQTMPRALPEVLDVLRDAGMRGTTSDVNAPTSPSLSQLLAVLLVVHIWWVMISFRIGCFWAFSMENQTVAVAVSEEEETTATLAETKETKETTETTETRKMHSRREPPPRPTVVHLRRYEADWCQRYLDYVFVLLVVMVSVYFGVAAVFGCVVVVVCRPLEAYRGIVRPPHNLFYDAAANSYTFTSFWDGLTSTKQAPLVLLCFFLVVYSLFVPFANWTLRAHREDVAREDAERLEGKKKLLEVYRKKIAAREAKKRGLGNKKIEESKKKK